MTLKYAVVFSGTEALQNVRQPLEIIQSVCMFSWLVAQREKFPHVRLPILADPTAVLPIIHLRIHVLPNILYVLNSCWVHPVAACYQ
jgi:hypothetical protein